MTFDDDCILLHFDNGDIRQPCRALGLEWPPPKRFNFLGITMERAGFSQITDEQREKMTNFCRGAEYRMAS